MKRKSTAWAAVALLAASLPPSIERAGAAVGAPAAEAAQREYDEVMALTPNLADGAKIYLACAVCHRPEGWGSPDGDYPQIAGQLQAVIVKQIADIRARTRDNPLMYPFAVPRVLGGQQEMADVAAYVSQLPMTTENGKGPGTDLALGERLYAAECAECHGDKGEGSVMEQVPALASQHYRYLMRELDAIQSGRRKNVDLMKGHAIRSLTTQEQSAVLDYASRLTPPPEKVAKPGWRNPDFPRYVRPPLPEFPPAGGGRTRMLPLAPPPSPGLEHFPIPRSVVP